MLFGDKQKTKTNQNNNCGEKTNQKMFFPWRLIHLSLERIIHLASKKQRK